MAFCTFLIEFRSGNPKESAASALLNTDRDNTFSYTFEVAQEAEAVQEEMPI